MRSLRLLAPPSCCLHRMARLVRILLLYWACQEGGHHFPVTSEQVAPSSHTSLCPSQHVPRIGRRARRTLTNALNVAWSGIRMPSSLPARQQRLRRCWGYRGVRVGEALHPGPSPGTPLHPAIGRGRSPSRADDAARPLRRRVAPPPDVVRCFCPVLVAGMLTPLGPAGGALTTQCGITLTIIAPGPWRVQCPGSTWTPIAWTFARCVGCWWRAGSMVFIPDVAHVPASSYLTIGPPA